MTYREPWPREPHGPPRFPWRLIWRAVLVLAVFGVGFRAGVWRVEREPPPLELSFSPEGLCEMKIETLIREAHSRVRVGAYGFTSRGIVSALLFVREDRGVRVDIILDKSECAKDERADKPPIWRALTDAGAHVYCDAEHPIFHDKVIIVDGKAFETGSYNFTAQAEKNAENCLVVHDEGTARAYEANWEQHRGHADEVR